MSKSFRQVPIGLKDDGGYEMLLPMLTEKRDGIGVYPIGALSIPSRNSAQRVLGTLLRKMPIAEMQQPYYHRLLLMLSGQVPERALYIESPPTTGKTTLGQVLAEAMDCPCTMINCGNISMDELVVETYVNGKQGQDLFSRLSAQLIQGEVSEFYLKRLRTTLDKALIHIERIDSSTPRPKIEALRERIGDALQETKAIGSGASEYGILWDKIPEAKQAETEAFIAEKNIISRPSYRIDLQEIHKGRMEEIGKDISAIASEMGLGKEAGGLGVGLATRNGRLLETILQHVNNREPAVIVLDEFTRRRDDGGSLQQLYEVMGGKRSECEVTGGDGKQHIISRKALADAGVIFIINANPKTPDEPNVLPAPAAFLSRLGSPAMSGYGQAGWQMRMEQFLADMPVTFILDAWRPKGADEQRRFNSEIAADLLDKVHEMGWTDEERANSPIHHKSFLRQHQQFSSATGKLAKFFDIWRQTADPESGLHGKIGDHGYLTNAGNTLSELRREAQRCDENPHHPSHNVKIDLRWLQKILTDSLTILPSPLPREQAAGTRWYKGEDEPEAQLGERLIRRIHQEIITLYPDPKSKIHEYLEMQMVRCGLCMGEELSLDDSVISARGAKPADVRVTSLPQETAMKQLNIPRARTISEEAKHWQGLLVRDLVEKHPNLFDVNALQNPDRILPVGIVHDALQALPRKMQEESFELEGIKTVPLIAVHVARDKKGIELAHALLVPGAKEEYERPDAARFLMTLAMPGATDLLKSRLWQKTQETINTQDEPGLICRGESKSGLAVTTLQLDDHAVEGEDGTKVPTYIHVLRFSHPQKEKFLMVGDLELDSKLKRQLRDQKVVYISRNESGAKEQLDKQLEEFVRLGSEQAGNGVDYSQQLHRAFRYRNEPEEHWRNLRAGELGKRAAELNEEKDLFGSKTLADLMFDSSLTHPHKGQVVVMAELSNEALDDLRAAAASKKR